MADTYGDRWTKAKAEFGNQTHKKKPREKLWKLAISHTGLTSALAAVDKAREACDKANNDVYHKRMTLDAGKKVQADYAKKQAALVKVVADYQKVLATEINKELGKHPDDKTVWEKGLKYLSKELKAICDISAQNVASSALNYNEMTRDKGVADKQLMTWEQNMQAAISKARSAIAKCKMMAMGAKTQGAAKAVQEYNASIPGGTGRDICMQLVFARKLESLRAGPDPAWKVMEAWNTKNTHTLREGASAEDVLAKVKIFSDAVKLTDAWFGSTTAKH